MLLASDVRTGFVYLMLFSFWVIFISEHLLDRADRNQLVCSCIDFYTFKTNYLLVKLRTSTQPDPLMYMLYVHLRLCRARHSNHASILVRRFHLGYGASGWCNAACGRRHRRIVLLLPHVFSSDGPVQFDQTTEPVRRAPASWGSYISLSGNEFH